MQSLRFHTAPKVSSPLRPTDPGPPRDREQTPPRPIKPKAKDSLLGVAVQGAFFANRPSMLVPHARSAMTELARPQEFGLLKHLLFSHSEQLFELTAEPILLLTPKPVAHFLLRAPQGLRFRAREDVDRQFGRFFAFTHKSLARAMDIVLDRVQPTDAHAAMEEKLALLLKHLVQEPTTFGSQMANQPQLLIRVCQTASALGISLVLPAKRRSPVPLLTNESLFDAQIEALQAPAPTALLQPVPLRPIGPRTFTPGRL